GAGSSPAGSSSITSEGTGRVALFSGARAGCAAFSGEAAGAASSARALVHTTTSAASAQKIADREKEVTSESVGATRTGGQRLRAGKEHLLRAGPTSPHPDPPPRPRPTSTRSPLPASPSLRPANSAIDHAKCGAAP